MKLELFGRITLLLGACGLAAALTGCAAHPAIGFHTVAPAVAAAAPKPSAEHLVSAAQSEVAAHAAPPAEAEPVVADASALGSLPADDVALLDSERSVDLAFGFQLTQRHEPGSLSFHCVEGEEALGCAARPAVTDEAIEEKPEQKTDGPIVVARNSREGEVQ